MPTSEQELIRELRAIRPEPEPDFAARLDEWAAAGFPPRRADAAEAPPRRADAAETGRARPRRRRLAWMPRVALAASLLAALVVSVGVLASLTNRGSDDAGVSSGGSGLATAPDRELDAASAPAAEEGPEGTIEPAPVPPGDGKAGRLSGDELLPGRPRIQERDAQMTLSTEPGQVAEVADGVVEVTERYDGIVVSSSVSTSAERGRASFDLRVPTANLQAALADLSDLASVKQRNEGSLDITAPYVGASERFADAKAAVDSLLAQLEDATSPDEVAEIREQLRAARGELAVARAELEELKRRADFSRVAVSVVGDGDADGWSLGDAVDDAGSVLEDIAGATLIALAVLLPLALVGAVGWWLFSRLRRTLRDRALDD